MTLDPVVVIIALFLWLMLLIVSVILEESYAKRIPAHKLRFPRYLGAVGIGVPFACGWMIYEMLHASDWETAKLFYLLLGIPAFLLLGLGGVWMTLHSLNWGMTSRKTASCTARPSAVPAPSFSPRSQGSSIGILGLTIKIGDIPLVCLIGRNGSWS